MRADKALKLAHKPRPDGGVKRRDPVCCLTEGKVLLAPSGADLIAARIDDKWSRMRPSKPTDSQPGSAANAMASNSARTSATHVSETALQTHR